MLRRPPNAPDVAQVGSGGFLIARQAITSTEEYWLKTFVLGAAFAALSSRHGDVFEFQSVSNPIDLGAVDTCLVEDPRPNRRRLQVSGQ